LDVAAVGVSLAGIPQVDDLALDADGRLLAPVARVVGVLGTQRGRRVGGLWLGMVGYDKEARSLRK
jgi:hypothetical protein